MEFLFSSFLGALGDSSPVGAAVTAALLSAVVSEVLAAGFGSSLVFAGGAGSAAAGTSGLAFFGSAAWKVRTWGRTRLSASLSVLEKRLCLSYFGLEHGHESRLGARFLLLDGRWRFGLRRRLQGARF